MVYISRTAHAPAYTFVYVHFYVVYLFILHVWPWHTLFLFSPWVLHLHHFYHLPTIPISDGSTLEFIPHHPAELWPSNSQPLWPQQMNNKTRALQQISEKSKEPGAKSRLSLSLTIAWFPVEWSENKTNMTSQCLLNLNDILNKPCIQTIWRLNDILKLSNTLSLWH